MNADRSSGVADWFGTTIVAVIGIACGAVLVPTARAQAQQRPPQAQPAQAQQPAAPAGQRPNILVIFGDDVGQSNISAYSHGLVGYKTPNIDRIAREGMMFTDYYAENSCTAGGGGGKTLDFGPTRSEGIQKQTMKRRGGTLG